ncbi:hypothetical protein DFAR_3060037 [Desulfarculales bacterium]
MNTQKEQDEMERKAMEWGFTPEQKVRAMTWAKEKGFTLNCPKCVDHHIFNSRFIRDKRGNIVSQVNYCIECR